MNLPTPLKALLQHISAAGGRGWLVGGSIRDHLLGSRPKDLDIEVHGLEAEALRHALSGLGPLKAVGRSFGVFKLRLGQDELDISLPQPGRSRTPQGQTVEIAGDPHMGITEALRRRDLTINAIAYDPLADAYADPFDGRGDLSRRVLRAVDEHTFADDPLRVLRVMQFAGRLGFSPTPELSALCRQLPIADLPGERLLTEFEKLLLKSPRPSTGLAAAREANIFARLFPALDAVEPAILDAALDAAAAARRQYTPSLALMLATLLHRCSPEDTEDILDRLKVFTMGGYPMRKRVCYAAAHWSELTQEPVSDARLRWMAEDGEVELTARVAVAAAGRAETTGILHRAVAMGISRRRKPALLKGRDLSAQGIPPGPWMGDILRRVRAAQLDGTIHNKEQAALLSVRLWKEHTHRGGAV